MLIVRFFPSLDVYNIEIFLYGQQISIFFMTIYNGEW